MTVYYVSCKGSDANTGLARAQAIKTLAKANTLPLKPGDSLLLKRGCTFEGSLNAAWNGTAAQPITIGAYGTGKLPVICNGAADAADGFHVNVKVSGSYLVIENIETTIVNPPTEPGCGNAVGWFVGFNFVDSAAYNTLRYCKATQHTAGVHMQTSTHHNKVLYCTFTDNGAMEKLTPGGEADDIGAWGILLKGSYHEVGWCYFAGNNAKCGYDTPPQGNSVELYEAKHNVIHHCEAWGDRVFSELGSSEKVISENNLFAYNLIVSDIADAKGWTTRGPNADFGPVLSTQLYHNTVYLTGAQSQAFNCGGGCDYYSMVIYNNIFWAEWKAGYFSDEKPDEAWNIYWSSDGTPYTQGYTIHPGSRKADPLFVDPAAGDFRLQPGSPAIDAGMAFGWPHDLAGTLVPQGGASDCGCYEWVGEEG